MSEPTSKPNKVLAKMLDRLFAGLMSGAGMNCRPHASRQRVDLTQLARLKDGAPEEILRQLLGPERSSRANAFRLFDDAGAVQAFGSDSPVLRMTSEFSSTVSQSIATPVASTARRAALATSGPIPSPGIKVTW